MIWLIVINKAHSVLQDGKNFRLEFKSAITTLKSLYDAMPTKCNQIAMSATFCWADQSVITGLLNRLPDKVIWQELSHLGIMFDINTSSCPTSLINQSVAQDYKVETNMKAIVYCNSKHITGVRHVSNAISYQL